MDDEFTDYLEDELCGDPYSDAIEHHGVLGMHWYVRRYQPYSYTGKPKGGHGELTEKQEAKKKVADAKRMKKLRKMKAKKRRIEAKEKARQAKEFVKQQKLQEQDEAERKRIINSGDAKLILANQNRLSDEELKQATDRANTINNMRRNMPTEPSTMDKVVKFTDNASKIYNNVSPFIKLYTDTRARQKEEEYDDFLDSIRSSNDPEKAFLDNIGRVKDNDVNNFNTRFKNAADIEDRYNGRKMKAEKEKKNSFDSGSSKVDDILNRSNKAPGFKSDPEPTTHDPNKKTYWHPDASNRDYVGTTLPSVNVKPRNFGQYDYWWQQPGSSQKVNENIVKGYKTDLRTGKTTKFGEDLTSSKNSFISSSDKSSKKSKPYKLKKKDKKKYANYDSDDLFNDLLAGNDKMWKKYKK